MNQPPVLSSPRQTYYGDNGYNAYHNGYAAAPPVESDSDSGLATVGYIFLRLVIIGVVIAIKVAVIASMR